ncbi:hypothetical protein Asppvi_000003 [Aspergillus pseudoviridinutans]|uniref:FAD/NAD(P)-binding domain-containing protein n=1 Tax=Aspergillus pseudoviridinutans TaxID=1517512 RepID=A0A9P3ENZ1_9EURO|nr:uncharacterized protein Asppvi_000003 [Aspergillus pseudoviridinutans]GIJ81504.1 hypothetical protein Asppvi_000003 [Aspergillus pseudoviridinutans]
MGSVSESLPVGLSEELHQKYAEERDKRLRRDGLAQFLDPANSNELRHFIDDPWVDHQTLNAQEPPLKDGSHCKFLILGAGYGGLLFAVRLIDAGFRAEDIRFVDGAGGFGGTWYWNRYPGLMCDVESSIYMPLLEETGYKPRHRYAYGEELREHANRIAEKWSLNNKALFRSHVKTMDWDSSRKQWRIKITQNRGPQQGSVDMQVHADFTILVSGFLNKPQVPKIPGFEEFEGQVFHTARWDYKYTGGHPGDASLTGLKDKRVGIIGTGATSIQVVPELAKWSQQLYVFQRTPSSVDVRNQSLMTSEQWCKEIACKKGWQVARARNYNSQISNAPIGPDLFCDAFTTRPALSGLAGGPGKGPMTVDRAAEHIAELHALDVERAESIRARVSQVVQDQATAEKLKAWYPAWCKRPCAHDEYLPAFNRPHVQLVDTEGKGVQRLTKNGVVANNKEYELDLLVLSTGFRSPAAGSGSPGCRADVAVTGRCGLSLDEKWIENGVTTLHGIATHGFPNMFFTNTAQAGFSMNYVFVLDMVAKHVAHIVDHATKKAGGAKVTVEVTEEAEEKWADEVIKRAPWFVGLTTCTPGVLNNEGEMLMEMDPKEQRKKARAAVWGEGVGSYERVLEEWREEGKFMGMEISIDSCAPGLKC